MSTATTTPASVEPPSRHGLLSFFAPAPAAPPTVTHPGEVAAAYRHWQPRILVASIVGYAAYYFVRKNLSMAMPAMAADLHITKTDLGLFLTLHGILYGVSKFANGFLGDRANAPRFMAAGLLLSALANIAFGSSSLAMLMGVFWLLNGWFQGMGFPPCARLLTHWFPPKQLATKMSIWNTSHSIGAGLIVILCGYIVGPLGWRSCFFVPAIIAILTAVYLLVFLRDTPESLGLPSVEHLDAPAADATAPAEPQSPAHVSPAAPSTTLDYESAHAETTYTQFLLRHVFNNPYIWLVSLANFFVYAIRYAILDWAPTFLHEYRHIELSHAGWMTAAFEGAGLAGALVSGYVTDRYFAGRGPRVCVVFMLACIGALYLFWRLPNQSALTSTVLLSAAGFFIYGPQCLIGVTAANLATKRAAAAAVGLTGLFGYASTILSGVGLGWLVQHYGWDKGFLAMLGIAGVGLVLFVLAWFAPVHGYQKNP